MALIIRMATGFQNVIEANQVCFHIGIRVRNGIADTRLRTEVHYDFRLILLKDRFDHSLVCQIAFYETEIFKLLQFVQTCFLQAHIIIVVHVVQTHNLDTLHRGEQTLCKVGTNETRYTRDKNAFVGASVLVLILAYFNPPQIFWMNNLQSVSIVAAFPIGAVIVMIAISFMKDAKKYMKNLEKSAKEKCEN